MVDVWLFWGGKLKLCVLLVDSSTKPRWAMWIRRGISPIFRFLSPEMSYRTENWVIFGEQLGTKTDAVGFTVPKTVHRHTIVGCIVE